MFGRHSIHMGRIRPPFVRSGPGRADTPESPPSTAPQPDRISDGGSDSAFEELDEALAQVTAFTSEDRVPGSVVINPLLGVWDSAHRIGADVAAPVEELLTVAVQRSTLRASEVLACVDEVRAVALQHEVLSQFVAR